MQLSLNAEGASRFGEATSNNIGSTISIISEVEGEDPQTISTANIESAITNGQAIISGSFTLESAQALADQIMAGTFDVQLALRESETISATLGDRR